jgi:hypothetical protein
MYILICRDMVLKNKECGEILGKDVFGTEGKRRRREGEFVATV